MPSTWAVPADARIVGICDAFDAMTSTRPYRRGMPTAQALAIIEENLGNAEDLEPEADIGLISRLVRESARAMLATE